MKAIKDKNGVTFFCWERTYGLIALGIVVLVVVGILLGWVSIH